jgi:hypothetical protein
MRFRLFLLTLIVALTGTFGCVTQTEVVSPYERDKDESVWEEIQREFGWQSNNPPAPPGQEAKPFYSRAAHKIKETVAGWFADDDGKMSEAELSANRRRFKLGRIEGVERLREPQEDEENAESQE